jgi:hypothetical protein
MSEGWGLEQYSAEFWKERYWTTVEQFGRMQHQYLRAKGLEEKNIQQAGRIAELEFYLSCFKRTGDTVIIDYEKLQRLVYTFEKVGR